MKSFLFGIAIVLLSVAATSVAQQDAFNPQPQPYVTPLDPGANLMMWSAMQEPRPTQDQPADHPQPLPDPQPETHTKNAPSQPSAQTPDAGQSGNDQASPAALQTFTGTIVRRSGKLVLKMDSSAATYQLDDQEKAKQYEGAKVKVIGTLDAGSGLIRVQQIQALS